MGWTYAFLNMCEPESFHGSYSSGNSPGRFWHWNHLYLEKWLEDYALKKWGSTLSTCVHAHGNNVKKIHGSFFENNYPLVYIHCIIKIMCQALVLGWLDCLFTMCSTKTKSLAVVREFTFFTGSQMGLKLFAHYFCTNCLNFHIFYRILGVTEVY